MKSVKIIHKMKTNIITQNGNINFGHTVQNSHTSNLKVSGATFTFGDCSPITELNKQTMTVDKNLMDQSES